jgi:hypothetical protein
MRDGPGSKDCVLSQSLKDRLVSLETQTFYQGRPRLSESTIGTTLTNVWFQRSPSFMSVEPCLLPRGGLGSSRIWTFPAALPPAVRWTHRNAAPNISLRRLRRVRSVGPYVR